MQNEEGSSLATNAAAANQDMPMGTSLLDDDGPNDQIGTSTDNQTMANQGSALDQTMQIKQVSVG